MYAEARLTSCSENQGVRILRFPDVVKKTGMSKSDIYGRIRRNEFPEPIQLGPRSVGFVENEINGWLYRLIANSRSAGAK